MNESIIIEKMISIGQHLEREEILYSGAEADARALLEEIKQERNLIRDAMMFAVKDMTGRVMREATVQSMIDDFEKIIKPKQIR